MKEEVERKDFIRFLNRIYYINSHLAERLDELKGSSLFTHVQENIAGAITSLELQLNQIDHLFDVLKAVNSYGDCASLVAFLENIFTVIQSQENNTPFLSLLDYITVADCLVEESARMANLSMASLPKLNLPGHKLFDPLTLESLKTSLYDTCVVN